MQLYLVERKEFDVSAPRTEGQHVSFIAVANDKWDAAATSPHGSIYRSDESDWSDQWVSSPDEVKVELLGVADVCVGITTKTERTVIRTHYFPKTE